MALTLVLSLSKIIIMTVTKQDEALAPKGAKHDDQPETDTGEGSGRDMLEDDDENDSDADDDIENDEEDDKEEDDDQNTPKTDE